MDIPAHHYSREADIDRLRILATGAVFLYHCARFFNLSDWHVKNNDLSVVSHLFVVFTGQWLMPLFFVLSAVAAFHALRRRTRGQFCLERFKRLVIPLVFGTLVLLIPVQVYIERVSHDQFFGSFLEFYPQYFNGFYAFGGNFAWMGLHLWYLEILFIFSMITLPLFACLNLGVVRKWIHRVVACLGFPLGFLAPALILLPAELMMNLHLHTFGRREFGGWGLLTYLAVFICGYVFVANPRYRKLMEENRYPALVIGLLSFTAGVCFFRDGISDQVLFHSCLRVLNAWAWLTVIFGFARRYMAHGGPMPDLVPDLVPDQAGLMPFYVLHQTVIVVIGFFLAGLPWPIPVKFLTLALVSFAVIMGSYELVIKRYAVLRILFGMKGRGQAVKKRNPGFA